MPNDGPLSKAKTAKDVEDFLQKTCKKPLRKLSNHLKTACFNFKTNNDLAEQNLILKMRTEETNNKLDAGMLINERLNQYQTIGALTFMAVVSASEKYELVLKTKANQSVGTSFLIDLISSFLPVIKPLERVVGRFISKIPPKRKLGVSNVDFGWSDDNEVLLDYALRDNFTKAVRTVDSVSDNVSQAVLKMKDGLDLSEESQQLLNSYTAKNAVFQGALEAIVAELVRVTRQASLYYAQAVAMAGTFASTHDATFKTKFDGMLKDAGLEDQSSIIDEEKFKVLSAQFYQAMLKGYAQKNVVLKLASDTYTGTRVISDAVGLDSAQRKLMYASFDDYKQYFPRNELVFSDEDLMNRWNVPAQLIDSLTSGSTLPPPTGPGYSPSRVY
jgi:hypothetical protein